MAEDKYLLQSVSNALKIVDILTDNSSLGLTEICRAAGFRKPSTFRLLYTLEASGYIIKTEENKYMLSRKFVYCGQQVVARNDNFSLARPELIRLRDQFGEAVHMTILLPNMTLMFIEKVEASYSLQMRSRIGFNQPAYCSGSGKVLLSALLGTEREQELKSIALEKKTGTTIDNYKDLICELQQIRKQGYAIDNEESEVGLTCIAVPVPGREGQSQYAISISGATQRVRENEKVYLQALKDTAVRIAELMGLG